MTNEFRIRQALTIAKIELRRAFWSKRAFWVYLLALFPAVIFFFHGLEVRIKRNQYSQRITPAALIDNVSQGDSETDVLSRLGTPVRGWQHESRRRVRSDQGDKRMWEEKRERHRWAMYYDGRRRADLHFTDGILRDKRVGLVADFEEDRQVFAGVFQYFYLRLAIFFGCLGIFMNLFRGEMLDKTLHFWFLAPVKREVLLIGKYLAGLAAATVIFTAGAMLCFAVMLWPHEASEVQAYWQSVGAAHAFWYAVAAIAGCIGYGSVFVAAGLLLRNPIIPAAVMLLWESINSFLPAMLQKLSVLYYLQSLCPVPPPMDANAPAVVKLLLSPAAPASRSAAIIGLLVLTGLVLWAASRAVRRIEISYSTE